VVIFKVSQKDERTKIRQIINDFLNDRIKEYASENNFNLYEKHDMNW
jgi:N-acetylneuraminic acid mutarotase